MPRTDSERFKIDKPFEEALGQLLGVDTDEDGQGDDGEPSDGD